MNRNRLRNKDSYEELEKIQLRDLNYVWFQEILYSTHVSLTSRNSVKPIVRITIIRNEGAGFVSGSKIKPQVIQGTFLNTKRGMRTHWQTGEWAIKNVGRVEE